MTELVENAIAGYAVIAAHRILDHDWELYSRLKRELTERFPDLEPSDYEIAIQRIARLCGC